jgi:hypothetical protein
MPAGLANEMLTPRPKVDPRTAGIVSDEDEADEADREATRQAQDAYVVSESGSDASTQNGGASQPALKKTGKFGERPSATTTPQTPDAQPRTTAPAAPEQKTNGAERPRRVSDRP